MFVLVNMSGLLATKMSLRGKKLVRSALLKRRGVPPATEEDMNTTGIRVIGHRGLGANTYDNDPLFLRPKGKVAEECLRRHRKPREADPIGGGYYRENSLEGVRLASEHGSEKFIEVDCQLTRDGQVVLWHDDYVHYERRNPTTGAWESERKRVCDITYEELARVSSSSDNDEEWHLMREFQMSREHSEKELTRWANPPSSTESTASGGDGSAIDGSGDAATGEVTTPMKNSGMCAPRLRDLLSSTPPSMGLNIEIKLFQDGEDVAAGADRSSPEISDEENRQNLVRAIFDDISEHLHMAAAAGQQRRQIFFSSFSPDACVEMHNLLERATREVEDGAPVRADCPVYFLTDLKQAHTDSRRTTFEAAVEFARGQGLDGVVCESSMLLKQIDASDDDSDAGSESSVSSAMSNAKAEFGLEIATYGLSNNDNELVMRQIEHGVTSIITDFPTELSSILFEASPRR